MKRTIIYLNDAGKIASPKMQMSCALCSISVHVLAHQDPVKVGKALGWIRVDNVPVDPDKPERVVHTVWICHEHTVTKLAVAGDQAIQHHPVITGSRR